MVFDIYTDGACFPNPGFGGWAVIVKSGDKETVLAGAEADTTNNRMELLAAIKGLSHIKIASDVVVHSDSQYLCYTIEKGWRRKVNHDLWAELDGLNASHRSVTYKWMRRNTHPDQARADQLANEQATRAAVEL